MADLRKIGLEGFALIDKLYGGTTNRRNMGAHDHHAFPAGRRERCWVVYQVPNDHHDMDDPASSSVSTRVDHAHAPVIHPKGKPQHRWGRLIKP